MVQFMCDFVLHLLLGTKNQKQFEYQNRMKTEFCCLNPKQHMDTLTQIPCNMTGLSAFSEPLLI